MGKRKGKKQTYAACMFLNSSADIRHKPSTSAFDVHMGCWAVWRLLGNSETRHFDPVVVGRSLSVCFRCCRCQHDATRWKPPETRDTGIRTQKLEQALKKKDKNRSRVGCTLFFRRSSQSTTSSKLRFRQKLRAWIRSHNTLIFHRSSCMDTVIPVGIWVNRTADSVLLTCCAAKR